MLHSNIQDRFQKTVTDPLEHDWHYQVKSGISDASKFETPYYLNLKNKNLIEAQKYLYDLNNNLLLKSDKEIAAELSSVDVPELFLPLLAVIPQRVTEDLVQLLKQKEQIIVHVSINHPDECTFELMEACNKLADNGIIINNHMTLLKGVNDNAEVVKELNLKLLMMRVRPYSIYIYERRSGESNFFKVTRQDGIDILEALRGWTSGLAVPHVLVQNEDNSFEAVLPNYVKKNEGESFVFRNYKHMDYEYFNS